MRGNFPGCLILLIALAAGAASAAEPKVYKWTDENGTVHFSAEPPAAAAAEEVVLQKGPTLTPPTAPALVGDVPTEDENAKRCQQHRDNFQLLEGATALTIEDKGQKRALTPAERTAQINGTKAALVLCESVPVAAAPK